MSRTKGSTLSLEARAHISAGLRGRKPSEETKAKIRAALKGRNVIMESLARQASGPPPEERAAVAEAEACLRQAQREAWLRWRVEAEAAYDESGLRCCTRTQWIEWAIGAEDSYHACHLPPTAGAFCHEADPGWCLLRQVTGRCMRERG